MEFDYSLLSDRIVEKCTTQYVFAYEMGLSERTMSLKMNSKVHWKDVEILKAINILEIDPLNMSDYFFKVKVQ